MNGTFARGPNTQWHGITAKVVWADFEMQHVPGWASIAIFSHIATTDSRCEMVSFQVLSFHKAVSTQQVSESLTDLRRLESVFLSRS